MTEAVKTNVIKEPSRIIPKRLNARTIAVKSTGEVIRVTNDHRIIYAHLEDQFRGLTNPKNIAAGKSTGHYYDSDENLAIKCDVSKSTFKKVKKDLKALGLIDWKAPKAKKSGHACEYFVKQLIDIAHNLEFIYQELPNGGPSYDNVRVRGLKTKKIKKAAQPKIEESENGVQKQVHEQQSGVPQSDSDSSYDAVNNSEQQSQPQITNIDDLTYWRESGPSGFGFMEYGAKHGEAEVEKVTALIEQHYFDALTIFDENGVVTEEFIDALSGNDAPKRNDDGTLKKYGFAYAMARAYLAHREGKSEEEIMSSIPVWIKAAQTWHVPANLLPINLTPSESPIVSDEEEFDEEGFDESGIPF
ncbi:MULTISPECIES: DUF6945 domain-containing protein [Citrobacter freundii complex]|uniref:DUF6945 domain-containing protein n=1 Tax=Citrobacter freundii complex TaxID=1344959 RepID=UPI0018AA7256|nr:MULTISPECIES: hypothetical protein [Citrobacter freundii complex]MCR3706742.1 hypothetical protein [Citrobacter freundii]MDT7438176.1 hypothetical protein [Citrobacter freundii]